MATRFCIISLAASALLFSGTMNAQTPPPDLRIGIIGLDTSHAEQFTMRLNDAANPNHIPGGRVVAAFPTGSPDLEDSQSRIEGYTATVRDKYGVKIVGSIQELCAGVDAVMVLSLDGRKHPEQAREVIAMKKPFFLDKPVAASLKDAVQIFSLADTVGVPMFSASAVRWYPGVVEVATAESSPAISALSYGPSPVLNGHPDLFFYGIHPTEALFTVMGSGCQSVARAGGPPDASVITGVWDGGRTGTLHALHFLPMESKHYKVVRFGGGQQVIEQKTQGDYTPMLREILKFFQTKQPPVTAAQTLEIYAFMEAAEESKRRKGASVALRDVLQKADCPEKWLPAKPAAPEREGAKPQEPKPVRAKEKEE